MSRVSWTIASLVVALLVAGCGGSSDPASAGGESGTSSQTSRDTRAGPSGNRSAPAASRETPAQVVAHFYEALRDGDDATIARLLTDTARSETANSGLKIHSLGNPSLSFEIRDTEYVTEAKDGAHVDSVWTEKGENAQSESIEVIWILRRQTAGWRIAGFAQVFPGDQPVVFNFEEPEHMLRTKEYVESEFYSQEDQPVMQATKPANPSTARSQLR